MLLGSCLCYVLGIKGQEERKKWKSGQEERKNWKSTGRGKSLFTNNQVIQAGANIEIDKGQLPEYKYFLTCPGSSVDRQKQGYCAQ